MGGFLSSLFGGRQPETPVKGPMPRLKNIAVRNFRGILGILVPLVLLPWQGKKDRHDLSVQCMWMLMFWFWLIQPVSVPATALIPIFLMPMTGVLSSEKSCACYMNDSVLLFITGGMLHLLLNNSGVDKRIALRFICSGDACQFSGKRLVLKCSTAAFFLSIVSNRLLVTSFITQIMTKALTDLQAGTSRSTEPNFDEMRYIINNAIQTSAAIGSTAMMHAATATLTFRAIWNESPVDGKTYPDVFNYFNYTLFAFPVAFFMFIANFIYHMILINLVVKKSMTNYSMANLRKSLLKHKETLPKETTCHEKFTVFFTMLALAMLLFRYSDMVGGWAKFSKEEEFDKVYRVRDTTVTSAFIIILHILPKGYGFIRYLTAEKKSELPPLKTESAILWWKFVDKNTNYGYIYLLGSGVAIFTAARETGLATTIAGNLGKKITSHDWLVGSFLVCLISIVLANIMSSVAACATFLPFVMSMTVDTEAPENWTEKAFLTALAVGIGSSFGFVCPFLYTPAYYCHYIGKVPIRKMIKYGALSAVICLIILWLALNFFAPALWGNKVDQIDGPSAKGGPTTPPGGAPPEI